MVTQKKVKRSNSKKSLNKKGKVNVKALVIILVVVIVVGVGAVIGIKLLGSKDDLGGGMEARIGTKTITQYRYYKWLGTCFCEHTASGNASEMPRTANTKQTDSSCHSYCKNYPGKKWDRGYALGNVKTKYSAWSTSSKVPAGYSSTNRETKQVYVNTASPKKTTK